MAAVQSKAQRVSLLMYMYVRVRMYVHVIKSSVVLS